MKKLMSILLAAAMLIAVFAGCTADKKDDENVTESTLPSGQVTTADAKIKDSDAINYIKNYYTVIAPVLQIFFPPPPFAAYPPQDHVFLCYRFDNYLTILTE